jgi:NAD(P)-dependent dehydrogenase (short-subunit alcohol dehydrogenase family)
MEKQKSEDPRTKGKQPPLGTKEQQPPGHDAELETRPDYGEHSYKGFGRLAGKVALVTGGDSGIGRAVALAFAREGADVAIAYLDEHDDARASARLVEDAGRRALLLPGDLADRQQCASVIERVARELGRLDVLVNNAAVQRKQVDRFEELDDETLQRTFAVNVLAMFRLTRHALAHLRPGATIVNTASIQAYQPSGAILDYAASKGAIVTFTKGLAKMLIERGIRANCVAPGPVWTPLVAQSFRAEKLARFGEQSPMKRAAQPAELAPAYVFLACDESRYVNGEVLGVTGGSPLA